MVLLKTHTVGEIPHFLPVPCFPRPFGELIWEFQLPELLAGGERETVPAALPGSGLALSAGRAGFGFVFSSALLGRGLALREAILSQEEPKLPPGRHWGCWWPVQREETAVLHARDCLLPDCAQ